MKIAVNTRHLLHHRLDGMGWFTLEIFKRLAENHPEVEFHFIFDRKFHPSFIFAKNVTPHVVGPPARHPYLMRIWYDWSVKRLLNKIKPDIFISPDAQLSLTSTCKQLIVVHDINFEHYPNDIPQVYTRDLKRRTPLFMKKAARVVTVSEFSKTDILKHYAVRPEKVGVVANAANAMYQPLQKEAKVMARERFTNGREYFIFISSIHPRKNLQRLLPAFQKFKEETGSLMKLLVVGNVFWKDDALKEAIDRGVESGDVIMAGRLDADDLSLALGGAMANLYVSYFEGFGIPVVEAFQAGVPVITSNVTSLPEVAGDAAILVDPFSIDEIKNALKKIAEDANLRNALIEKGFERSKSFSWEKSAHLMWEEIQIALKWQD